MECSVTTRQWAVYASPMQVSRLARPTLVVLKRYQSDTSTQPITDGERRIITKLQKTFPKASEVRVIDISGLYL